MPVIINGSTGISGTGGSTGTPAVQGTDTNTGMWFPAADEIAFSEGGVEALRLNASGNAIFSGTVRVGGISADLYPLVLGTAQNTTSGTFVDFTGIPSWAKRITVIFNGVSTSTGANLLVQLGTSAGLDTAGYVGSVSVGTNGTGGGGNILSVNGFIVRSGSAIAAPIGSMVIHNVSGNIWVSNHTLNCQDSAVCMFGAGGKTLTGTLDRLRLTSVGGTDTLDAGSVNVMWEG